MSRTSDRLKVLMLSSPASECALLLKEALGPHVDLVTAGSLAECLRMLSGTRSRASSVAIGSPRFSSQAKLEQAASFDAFLCDWCYMGGTWRTALDLIRRRAPQLPVIVVCRAGGEQEWVEVLQAGAFDMITAPFSADEVLFALTNAVAARSEPELAKSA